MKITGLQPNGYCIERFTKGYPPFVILDIDENKGLESEGMGTVTYDLVAFEGPLDHDFGFRRFYVKVREICDNNMLHTFRLEYLGTRFNKSELKYQIEQRIMLFKYRSVVGEW